MELELEFNITRKKGDSSSTSKLRIAKDRAGPIFLSRETETMFILTAHLKGFPQDSVRIKINEDGTRITISGKKPVQEIVTKGWIVYKNEGGIKGFAKVFQIPDGVVMDRIKAKFDEHDSVLTVSMPKLVKGIRGHKIEEVDELEVVDDQMVEKKVDDGVLVKDRNDAETRIPETAHEEVKEEIDENVPQTTQVVADKVVSEIENNVSGETLQEETTLEQNVESPVAEPKKVEPEKIVNKEVAEQVLEQCTGIPNPTQVQQNDVEEEKAQEPGSDIQETPTPVHPADEHGGEEKAQARSSDVQAPTPVRPADEHEEGETWGQEENHHTKNEIEETKEDQANLPDAEDTKEEKTNDHGEEDDCHKTTSEWSKLSCPIVIAGSAIVVSLFVYAVHSIRNKKHK